MLTKKKSKEMLHLTDFEEGPIIGRGSKTYLRLVRDIPSGRSCVFKVYQANVNYDEGDALNAAESEAFVNERVATAPSTVQFLAKLYVVQTDLTTNT